MAVPPTVATPSPTPCSDKTFWYDGQVCTNEKVPPDGEENYGEFSFDDIRLVLLVNGFYVQVMMVPVGSL